MQAYNTAYRCKAVHGTQVPRRIVVHTTEGRFPSDRDYLVSNPRQVGAHFYIAPLGDIYQMADMTTILWHCGVDDSKGERTTNRPELWTSGVWPADENNGSVGIEVSAAYNIAMSQVQRDALVKLITQIVDSAHIIVDRLHVVGHYELKNTKIDPPHFDMDKLVADVHAALEPPPVFASVMYPQTGYTVAEPFLSFFNAGGGVAQFGYPLSLPDFYTNDKTLIVQLFENVRMEYRPPGAVRLGGLGRDYQKLAGK